jgi:hypothetical protein
MARWSKAWQLGFKDGEDKAIHCCFGWTVPIRDFDTAEEQADYRDGFDAGYESVD